MHPIQNSEQNYNLWYHMMAIRTYYGWKAARSMTDITEEQWTSFLDYVHNQTVRLHATPSPLA